MALSENYLTPVHKKGGRKNFFRATLIFFPAGFLFFRAARPVHYRPARHGYGAGKGKRNAPPVEHSDRRRTKKEVERL